MVNQGFQWGGGGGGGVDRLADAKALEAREHRWGKVTGTRAVRGQPTVQRLVLRRGRDNGFTAGTGAHILCLQGFLEN